MVIKKETQTAKQQIIQEKDTEILAELSLMDDEFMSIVFDKNIEATELLLSIILNRSDLTVTDVIAQREYKNPNPGSHSVKFDVYATDNENKAYDVEVQVDDRGADVHRARFNSSMLDARMLKSGEDYKNLHDSYVIFITENDVLGKGYPLYHIDRKVDETNESFADGSHIIYVNGRWKDGDDPLGKLMHDFHCKNADDMYYSELAESVRYFKERETGGSGMSKIFDEIRREAAEKAAKEAEEKAKEEIDKLTKEAAEKAAKATKTNQKLAGHLYKDGYSTEKIAVLFEVPKETVESWLESAGNIG